MIKRVSINGKQSSAANSLVSFSSKTKVKQILTKDAKNNYVAIINNDYDKKVYTIEILQASTRKHVVSLNDHPCAISCVTFNASSNQVLSGSEDKILRLWDLASGKLLNTFKGHTRRISCVTFNASGSQVLSGSYDRTLRLWDVLNGQCLEVFARHNDSISSCAFNASGSQIISGSDDGSMRLWDVKSGYCLRTFNGRENHAIKFLSFNTNVKQNLPVNTTIVSNTLAAIERKKQIENDHVIKSASIETRHKILTTLELYWQGIFNLLDKLNNGDKDTKIAAIESLVKLAPSLSEAALTKVIEALLIASADTRQELNDTWNNALHELNFVPSKALLMLSLLDHLYLNMNNLYDFIYLLLNCHYPGIKFITIEERQKIFLRLKPYWQGQPKMDIDSIELQLLLEDLKQDLNDIKTLKKRLIDKNHYHIIGIPIEKGKLTLLRLKEYWQGKPKLNIKNIKLQLLDKFDNEDGNVEVAISAVQAVGKLGTRLPESLLKKVIEALLIALKNKSYLGLKDAAAEVLGELSSRLPVPMLKDVKDALMAALYNTTNAIPIARALGKLSVRLPEAELKKIINTFITNLTEQHLHGVDAALSLVELSQWLSENHINGLGEALVTALNNNNMNEKVIYDIAIILEKLINRLSDDDVVRGVSKFFFTAVRSKHKFIRIYAPLVLKALSSRLPEIALNELCEALIIVLKNKKWYDSWLSPGGRVIAAQSLGELSARLPEGLLEEVTEALLITFENVSGHETSLEKELVHALEKLIAKLPESDLKKKSEASLTQKNFVTKPLQDNSNIAILWSANNQLSLPISLQHKGALSSPSKIRGY